eukprot:gene9383-10372_t
MAEESVPEHQADHVEFCYDGKFIERQGETWFRRKPGAEEKHFCDFQVKLLGSIAGDDYEEKEGHWLAKITCKSGSRTTALPASFLDSRTKFETTIRKKFGRGLFNVAGDIKAADLSEYLRYLKHDYVVHGMERSCQNAPFIGFYDPDYWVLSETQQIKNGRLLREDEREYVIIDNNVKAMSVAINKNLIGSFSNFLEVIKIEPMLMAMAFTLTQLLRKMFEQDSTDETSHAMIMCGRQNVGKSKCLEILASGIGAPDDYCHPMFLSGGDSMQSGTTPKRIQESLSCSNMVCFINEATNSNTMTEFILQAHDGYLQGSCTSGLSKSRAKVLSTSNSGVTERIDGRTLTFYFKWDASFTKSEEDILKMELQPTAQMNKGYLIAWAVHFGEFWKASKKRISDTINNIIRDELPNTTQRRWTSGMSSTLATYCMLAASAGKEIGLGEAVKSIVFQRVAATKNDDTFFEELGASILKEIEDTEESEVLTWLNPSTYFRDSAKRKIQSIAIAVNVFNRISNASHMEIHKKLEAGGVAAFQASVIFCKQGPAHYADLSKKEKTKNCRANKIPHSKLSPTVMIKIREVCGLPEGPRVERDLEEPERTFGLSREHCEELAKTETTITAKMQSYIESKKRQIMWRNDTDNSMSAHLLTVLESSPLRDYLKGNPQMKSYYEKGYGECMRRLGMQMTDDQYNTKLKIENKTAEDAVVSITIGRSTKRFQLETQRFCIIKRLVKEDGMDVCASKVDHSPLLIGGSAVVHITAGIQHNAVYYISDIDDSTEGIRQQRRKQKDPCEKLEDCLSKNFQPTSLTRKRKITKN